MKIGLTIGRLPGSRLRIAAAGCAAFSACAALAQVAGPLLAVPGNSAVTTELGALILSPAQRRSLESTRNAEGNPDATVQSQATNSSREASPGLPDALVVSGVVVRSGNRSTVWINDQPLYGQAAGSPLRTLAGQVGVLQPRMRDMQLKARPGQVIDVPSGQSVDLLPPGAIRIVPPKASTNPGPP